jgi:hypothetical protein
MGQGFLVRGAGEPGQAVTVRGPRDLLQPRPGSTELSVNDQLARDEHIQ